MNLIARVLFVLVVFLLFTLAYQWITGDLKEASRCTASGRTWIKEQCRD